MPSTCPHGQVANRRVCWWLNQSINQRVVVVHGLLKEAPPTRAIVLVLFRRESSESPGCPPAACGHPGVGGWCRQRPLRASDKLVSEVGDTLTKCPAVDEAHVFL